VHDHERQQRQPQTSTLDRRWLKSKTKVELVDLLVEITLELKGRLADETSPGLMFMHEPPSFPDIDLRTVRSFQPLPAGDLFAADRWRVVLISSDPDRLPLGLDICGDITIGRQTENTQVDLDLTSYRAEELGVSREHALLRPAGSGLMLFDMGSANGTFRNGERATLGHYLEVVDGDTITFGGVHFKVMVIDHP